jgi:uncharacterized protein (DUF305 family)
MIQRIVFSSFAILLTLQLAGCSAATRVSSTNHPASAARPATTDTSPASEYPFNSEDVHFMSSMIPHHAQAIVMAKMAPTHGASASVQTLAARIINSQADEITSMQQWLRDKGLPVPSASADRTGMAMPGMDHEMLMPGMLTAAQLKQLDDARGAAFDRLFLQFMIQHHRGAIAMVDALFSTQGAAQDQAVFKFASDVNVDQSTEIDRMEKMLASAGVTR